MHEEWEGRKMSETKEKRVSPTRQRFHKMQWRDSPSWVEEGWVLSMGCLSDWVDGVRSSVNSFSSVKTDSLELVVRATVGDWGLVGTVGPDGGTANWASSCMAKWHS